MNWQDLEGTTSRLQCANTFGRAISQTISPGLASHRLVPGSRRGFLMDRVTFGQAFISEFFHLLH